MLSENDKRQLRVIGWEEGQAIPPDFAREIKRAQMRSAEEMEKAREQLIEEGRKAGGRVKIGKELRLDELPPDEQERLRGVLASYQTEMRQEQARQAAVAAQEARVVKNADPSVAQAHRVALAASDEQQVTWYKPQAGARGAAPAPPAQPEVEIVQSAAALKPHDLPPEIRPREGAEIAGAENLASFVTHPGTPRSGAVEEPVPEPETTAQTISPGQSARDAGGAPSPIFCPRCLHDVREPWELVPDDADKQQFMGAILGGTRFTKTIAVMDGQLQITYRSLTSDETDLVFKQLGIDTRQGKILDDGQYFMQLQAYRLVMSVSRFENANNECLVEIPSIHEIDIPEEMLGHDTRLVPMVDWFNKEAVPHESLRRMVAQHHRLFQRLVETLEVMTAEPDFWKGIRPLA